MAAALIPIIASIAGGAAGGLANRASTAKSGTTYSPMQQALLDSLTRGFHGILNNTMGGGLIQSIITNMLGQIDTKQKAAESTIQNLLTSRGLSRTTGGTSMLFNPTINAMNEKARIISGIPQLKYDLATDALGKASNFMSSIRGEQYNEQPGNILGGIATGGAAAMSKFLGDYWQNKYGIKTPTTFPQVSKDYGNYDTSGNIIT